MGLQQPETEKQLTTDKKTSKSKKSYGIIK
jgi:hypothetical protein